MLDDFDIYAVNNNRNTAVDRSFIVTVTDGLLNVTFGRVTDNPIISAVEVLWAGSSPATPLVTYTYRGDGLRNSKTITTTNPVTYTWDINRGLPEVIQDGSWSYVYGLGLISRTDGTGLQHYYLADGLGSIRKLTDSLGGVAEAAYNYDIFGSYRYGMDATWNEYRFTGQPVQEITGLYYLRARYYDSFTGRFLSKDPFPGVLTNPASQHYYAYAQNNPVNWTDPSGRCPLCTETEYWLEQIFNATATPAYAPADEADLASLASRAEACGTGSAVPAIDTAAELTGAALMFAPSPSALVGRLGFVAKTGGTAVRFDKDATALIELARTAKRTGGVTVEQAGVLKEWAQEYKVLFRGPEMHPNRPIGKDLHIHVGPVDKVLIKP